MDILALAKAGLLKAEKTTVHKKVKCSRCYKILSHFYFHPSVLKSPTSNKTCKQCLKGKSDSYYKDNKERVLARQIAHNSKPETKARIKEYREEYNQRPEVKECVRQESKLQRDLHPVKHNARRRVQQALEDGRLVRHPCEVCGTFDNLNAHHDDYSRLLDVRWLCVIHHKEWHRAND